MTTHPLTGCSPFSEFLVRHCLEQPVSRYGDLRTQDLLVHYYPHEDSELPADILAQLEDCGNPDRVAVTSWIPR